MSSSESTTPIDHKNRPIFLPPESDEESCRQLDLFVWGEAYAKADAVQFGEPWQWYNGQLHNLGLPPDVRDYADIGQYLDRVNRHNARREELWRQFEQKPIRCADKAALRGTNLSFGKTASLIWERDNGICQACLRQIEEKSRYQCGHIIDRVLGGSDRLSNLVVMCIVCNQTKPPTCTRKEYVDWVQKLRRGGLVGFTIFGNAPFFHSEV